MKNQLPLTTRILNALFFLLFTSGLHAQVGVGTTTPDAGAALDIVSTDKGLLIPRLDTTAVTSPADGMMIYRPGDKAFYYFDGTYWQKIGSASVASGGLIDADGDTEIQVEATPDDDIIRFVISGEEKVNIVKSPNGIVRTEYPGNSNNIAHGYFALYSNTTGINNIANGPNSLAFNTAGNDNIAHGFQSLYSNTIGDNNIANGKNALFTNTTGYNNIANGENALNKNTSGVNNIANGNDALFNNTIGSSNIANGQVSLFNNTRGSSNIANGLSALYSNTSGYNNIANGQASLFTNITGSDNIANGYQSLYSNTIGGYNIANGYESLYHNTTGSYNIANGYESSYSNTTGSYNIANGYVSLYHNTTGSYNIANGYYALHVNMDGEYNVANGYAALADNTSGNYNIANGSEALKRNQTGSNNIGIGKKAVFSNIAGNNNIGIGEFAGIDNTGSNNIFLGPHTGQGNVTGSGNIFIGLSAGSQEENSNRLYIHNDDGSQWDALIYGEFDNDLLRVNGAMEIISNNAGILIPKLDSTYVTSPVDGMLIYQPSDLSFYYYKGSQWEKLGGQSTLISDADGDTHIQVEASPDDDIIRYVIAGEEKVQIIKSSTGIVRTEYPGNNDNIAHGNDALFNNATGINNIANGFQSLFSNTTGSNNIANGNTALAYNTEGGNNIANGRAALYSNTTGSNNIANGFNALGLNTEGSNNIANGFQALYSNTTGSNNIAIGENAGKNAIGSDKLYINSSATASTAFNSLIYGDFASDLLRFNGNVGINTLNSTITLAAKADANDTKFLSLENSSGFEQIRIRPNDASTKHTMIEPINTNFGAFFGNLTGQKNTGQANTFIGSHTAMENTSGTANTFVGTGAGEQNETGNNNTYLGRFAGRNSTGSGNVFLGASAGYNETGNNKLYINNDGGNETNALIYGDFDSDDLRFNADVGIGRLATTNKLEVNGEASKTNPGSWAGNSDARLKKNIQQLQSEEALAKLLQLQGVTYEWNDNKTSNDRPQGIQYGFTAQNIATVYPTLVEKDAQGYLQTAYGTYDAMTVEAIRAMNNKIEHQAAIIQAQEDALEALQANHQSDIVELKQEMNNLRNLMQAENLVERD